MLNGVGVKFSVGFLKGKSVRGEDETRRTWRTPSISDALMRISSHGRASKRGRKTLCNVCAEAILGVLVIANRDRAVYVGRAHASTTHEDRENTRARDMHTRRKYVRLRKLESRRILGVWRGSLTRAIFTIQTVSFGSGVKSNQTLVSPCKPPVSLRRRNEFPDFPYVYRFTFDCRISRSRK